MSDEGIKWLIEEREMWKRRAEVAEAELVHRDTMNDFIRELRRPKEPK